MEEVKLRGVGNKVLDPSYKFLLVIFTFYLVFQNRCRRRIRGELAGPCVDGVMGISTPQKINKCPKYMQFGKDRVDLLSAPQNLHTVTAKNINKIQVNIIRKHETGNMN